ncbi:hypothetical protein [Kitasatospora sp. NPDC094015]
MLNLLLLTAPLLVAAVLAATDPRGRARGGGRHSLGRHRRPHR